MLPTAVGITCKQCDLCTRRPQFKQPLVSHSFPCPPIECRPCSLTIAGQVSHGAAAAGTVSDVAYTVQASAHVLRSHAPPCADLANGLLEDSLLDWAGPWTAPRLTSSTFRVTERRSVSRCLV